MKNFITKALQPVLCQFKNKTTKCKQREKEEKKIKKIPVNLPTTSLGGHYALEEYEALVFKKTRNKPFA